MLHLSRKDIIFELLFLLQLHIAYFATIKCWNYQTQLLIDHVGDLSVGNVVNIPSD